MDRFDGQYMAVIPKTRETGDHVVPPMMLLELVPTATVLLLVGDD